MAKESSVSPDLLHSGGRQGAGTREKGYGRRERKELETVVFRGLEAGTTLMKRWKNIINNNFNIIMLFDLHIASTYTNDTNALAKIRLWLTLLDLSFVCVM